MTVGEIVASLDDEIARLQKVRALLSGGKVSADRPVTGRSAQVQ
jgi:hypothetical protein